MMEGSIIFLMELLLAAGMLGSCSGEKNDVSGKEGVEPIEIQSFVRFDRRRYVYGVKMDFRRTGKLNSYFNDIISYEKY